jgi:hypothetical protein
VLGLPLWLAETHPRQFRDMIALQLEARGLARAGGEMPVFDWDVVAREETRTLVLVGLLPMRGETDQAGEAFGAFDVALRFFRFPADALTLWLEQDRICAAFTRGEGVVFFQAFAAGQALATVAPDLHLVRAALQLQGVIGDLKEVVAWIDLTPPELGLLRTGLRLPCRTDDPPTPAWPAQKWNLTPAPVREALRLGQARQWRKRAIAAVVALYLLIAGVMAWNYFSTAHAVASLAAWQARHAPALAMIHGTAAAWKELSPVVDATANPLEELLGCATAIPSDHLHLTLFETSPGHILIKGEATNAAAAFQYLDQLKRSPQLNAYTWEMAQPHLLPNDLAQFQIEGDHASTHPE